MTAKRMEIHSGVPVLSWAEDLDRETVRQAENLARLPLAAGHVAIMPDAHVGYGMPIGGVLAARGVVIPNAVGVDIGCGMCARRSSLTSLRRDELERICAVIRRLVPLGFRHHRRKQRQDLMPAAGERLPVVEREYENALFQLGTLGGGNHFIEIQQGSDGRVWLMVHSGSRNLGFRVANHYNRTAAELNRRWKESAPPGWQLAHLPAASREGRLYLAEMRFCVEFAAANRRLIMERVEEAVRECRPGAEFDRFIDIAHNHAALERHFGEEVYVHRKGATPAERGMYGIVPGSQGSPSYIVRGLGNPESFRSCAHGAGRRLGRKQARRLLSLEEERKRLDRQGIVHSLASRNDLDEAAGAYKDITRVMRLQDDLVEVVVELTPLAVVKG